jgi:predicted outer membrane repeat protein
VSANTARGDGGGVFNGLGDVTLIGSTVGGNSAGGGGGGISATNGNVALTNSTLRNNLATNGGGGMNTKTATLSGSTVTGNNSGLAGGGISTGTVTLTNSTVSDNTAANAGGGILAGIAATLVGSTVSGNTAGTQGGGIFASTTNLTNSTISGNTSGAARIPGGGGGGGVFAQHGTFLNSTIVENRSIGVADSDGAGVASRFGITNPIRLKNTIIAQNFDADFQEHDVFGLFASDGNNLIGLRGGDAGGFDELRDLLGTHDAPIDPVLGDLANNGGPTKTHALLAGSPAIDRGNNVGAPSVDQRGLPRIKDGNGDLIAVVDIGAFER